MVQKFGGLGIKDLKASNIALLGKWQSRLSVEKGRLWLKVYIQNMVKMVYRNERECGEGFKMVDKYLLT